MLHRIVLDGVSQLIMHSSAGVDPLLSINVEKAEITRKRGSNRTAADDARLRELETVGALWLDANQRPTIPASALRATIEAGARRLKQGQQVREGMVIIDPLFEYDTERYGTTLEELQQSVQFTVPVVVQRNRLLRTRALFDVPWSCTFSVDGDEELVSKEHLERWLDIAGRRIGLGDWRPEKSGTYGRFEVRSIEYA